MLKVFRVKKGKINILSSILDNSETNQISGRFDFRALLSKDKSYIDIILLTILALYTRFQYAYMMYKPGAGFPLTRDSYWYIDAAKELIQDFNISFDLNGLFYISYYGLLALILAIFKTEIVMVLLQVLINALSVILVYRISEMAFSRRVAIIASIIYISSRELKFWSVYLLTDSPFVSVLILAVYFLMKFNKDKKKHNLYLFIGSLIFMALLRPAGVVTIFFLIVYFLINADYTKLIGFIKKHLILSTIIIVTFLSGAAFVTYKVLYSSLGMSFYWNLKWLLYGNYAEGHIFDIPTPYDHKYAAIKLTNYFDNTFLSFFINNWYHILIIYIKRFISFWGELWIWHFRFKSAGEALDYFMRLTPIMVMFFGMLRAVYKRMLDKALILYVPIVSSVIFCMIFFLDNGWRYRIPSIPFNSIFLAFGIDFGIEIIIKLVKKLPFKKNVEV